MPDYPTPVRPVSASLRDAAGAWPAAVWLALAAVVAIEGGGGASSGGIALGVAVCLGALALTAVATAAGVYAPTLPPRRVQVYVGALALTALASYASIAWSLTPQTSYGDANRWLVAAGAAATGALLAGLLRRPLESAAWVLCAASLPLVAYAVQQRVDGVFFQTSPRLQGVLGYPNAIGAYAALAAPAALWLASSPQRARRVAGSGTLALLVLGLALASSRGGMLAAVIGCAAWFALSDRRTEAGAAALAVLVVTVPVARWGIDLRSFKALDAPFTVPAGDRLVWYSAAAVLAAAILGPLAVELAQGADERMRRICGQVAAAVLVIGALAAAVKLSSAHGGPVGALSHAWSQISGGGAVGSTDHLNSLSTNLRSRWWGEAWDGFTAHPLQGNGADTFETIDRLARPDFQQAGQEHSILFHVLSGLGLLGAIPAAIALAAAGACVAAVTRLRGSERSAGARTGCRRRRVRAAQPDRLGVEAERPDAARLPDPRTHRLRGRRRCRRRAPAAPRPRGRRRGRLRARNHPRDAAGAEQSRARPGRTPRRSGPARRGARRGRPRGRARSHVCRCPARARQPAAGARPPARRASRRRPRALARAGGRPGLADPGGLPALVLERPGVEGEPRPRACALGPRQRLRGLR